MKKITLTIGLFIAASFAQAQNGLDSILVEMYYVSDEADSVNAADNGATSPLRVGSITYRVFADLEPGYKFIQMFGSPTHDFKVNTTTDFYNDPNNGSTFPQGNSVINTRKNTTLIDSWFAVGGIASGKMGVLKSEDTDGSIGNAHNVLQNNALFAGIQINGTNAQDGLMDGTPISPNVLGISNELDIFDQTPGNSFLSNNCAIAALGGVSGITGSNMVLLGQFTTNGDLSFELNIQLATPSQGGSVTHVAKNPTGDEIQDSTLIYNSHQNNSTASVIESKISKSLFSIYPNPAADEFTFFVSNCSGKKTNSYIIADVLGNVMLQDNFAEVSGNLAKKVNISAYPDGIYFVTISLDDEVSTLKLIKK